MDAVAASGRTLPVLLRRLEESVAFVPLSQWVSAKVLLAAADAIVRSPWPGATTTDATLWVMDHDEYPGLSLLAVTSDRRRYVLGLALGNRWLRPRLELHEGEDACERALEATSVMERKGHRLVGTPSVSTMLDVEDGSLAALVRASIDAGWGPPPRWPM